MINYSSYGITFDGKGEWRYGNDYAISLILGEGDTFGINGSFGAPEKKFSINFSKANKKVGFSLHYNVDNSCLFINGKEVFKFKADNKNVNFPTQFCLERISNRLVLLSIKKYL